MEIRSTSADDPNSTPERIDITRKNREAIQSRQPLMPKPAEAPPTRDPNVQAKAVLAAREAYRAKHQGRIANARLDYTERHAELRAQQIAAARDVYEARIEKALSRRIERAEQFKEHGSTTPASADKLELSDASQRLSQLDSGSHGDDKARAERVADLKKLYESGMLNTSDLIARAAQGLLGDK